MTVLLELEPRVAQTPETEVAVEFAEKWDDRQLDNNRCPISIPRVTWLSCI
jgi:hypothetical protein